MSESIETLSKALGIAESQLKGIRRQYRMEHGKDAESELLKWLKHTWEEKRDKVRRLGKGSGYSEFWSGSMGASERHLKGNLHTEAEGVREDIQNLITLDARTRRAQEQDRAREQQKAQIRAAAEALREKARRGEDLTPYLAHIQRSERAA